MEHDKALCLVIHQRAPLHVQVMCSLWRLLLDLPCNLVMLLRVMDQQPLRSREDRRGQLLTSRAVVAMVTSERFKLTCLRHRSGGWSVASGGLAA